MNGSIEIAPILDLSDVIVDIVETGTTLKENNLEVLEEILPYVDLVLIMSVNPGYGGQAFIESSYEKIRGVRQMIQGKEILLSVDGGVNFENVRKLEDAGVTMAVAGSTVFRAVDRENAIIRLRGE